MDTNSATPAQTPDDTPAHQTSEAAPARDTASQGDGVDSKSLFVPLDFHFLSLNRPLYFTAYELEEGSNFKPIVVEGDAPPAQLRREVRSRGMNRKFFIRARERRALIAFGGDMLPDILADDVLPVSERCSVLHGHTTLLCQDIHEKASAYTINNLHDNAYRITDFVLREPAAIRSLLQLAFRDYCDYTHSVNVGFYGLALAMNSLPRNSNSYRSMLCEVCAALFLHDLGKSVLSKAILNKEGPLTREEWVEMRRHPEYGIQILRREKLLTPHCEIIVWQHHEKMDGSGYPKGVSGDAIHFYARICSQVDAYDALTTQRSYKPANTPFEALKIMKQEMYAQFDPEVFACFVNLISRKSGDA